jgi:hypothetical protein
MSDIPKCAFPGCNQNRQSKGPRPVGSPVAEAGDKNLRHKWCKYHRHGRGKAARMALAGSVA